MEIIILAIVFSALSFLISESAYFEKRKNIIKILKGLTYGIFLALICFKILPEIYSKNNVFISAFFTIIGIVSSAFLDRKNKNICYAFLYIFSVGILTAQFIEKRLSVFILFSAVLLIITGFDFKEFLKKYYFLFSIIFSVGLFIGIYYFSGSKIYSFISSFFIGTVLYNVSSITIFESKYEISTLFGFLGFIFETFLLCYF